MKTLEALTEPSIKHGQTGLIGHNISATDCKLTKRQIAGWSFALHHIIGSYKKEEIVKHIACCAPLYIQRQYPELLLEDTKEMEVVYRNARKDYILHKLPEIIEEYKAKRN